MSAGFYIDSLKVERRPHHSSYYPIRHDVIGHLDISMIQEPSEITVVSGGDVVSRLQQHYAESSLLSSDNEVTRYTLERDSPFRGE